MKLLQFVLSVAFAVSASTVSADKVNVDDTIVQGNLCVGADCANGEDFSGGALKLKENNTRIRWHDTSVEPGASVRQSFLNTYVDGVIGQSWRVDANQSTNGGDNDFYLSQLSLEDYPVLSDGSAPDYDCTSMPRKVVGTIAAGQPAENEATCNADRSFIQRNTLVVGGGLNAGVALGIGSTIADGEVSIGSAELKRRLVHVASAIADTDVLIKEQLDMGLFSTQRSRLDEIEALMSMAENELLVLEEAVKPKGGGGAFGWLILLLPLIAVGTRKRKSLA